LNKADLIGAVAEIEGMTKKKAAEAVNIVFDKLKEAMAKGDKVQLVGFGTFSVAERKARTGRNPQTGKKIKIKAKKVPKFKAGKELKEACK